MLNKMGNKGEPEPRIEDYEEFYHANSIQKELIKSEQRQYSSDIDSDIEAIIVEESQKTNEAKIPNQSKASQTKAIKPNRKEEREYIRERDNWDDTIGQNHGSTAELLDFDNEISDETDQHGESNSVLSMLKQQSEKRRSAK